MNRSIRVLDIALKLEKTFPSSWAQKWDKTRFSFIGDIYKPTSTVIGCLDVTQKVVKKAIECGAKLIISRHPLVFLDSSFEEREFFPYKREIFKLLKNHKISVFSLHSNFEKEGGAIKEILLKLFDNQDRLHLQRVEELVSGWIIDSSLTINKLISLLKEKLELENFRILEKSSLSKTVSKILFLSGSWGTKNFLNFVNKNSKIDLVITSDLKWNDWIALQESNVEILEVPHLIEQHCENTLKKFFNKNFQQLNYLHFWENIPYKNQN